MSIKEVPFAGIAIRPSRTLTTTLTLRANALVLWDLCGPQGTLRCRAIPTTYGYAFVLLLANDLIVWDLFRTVEALTEKASRVEAGLRARGWCDLPTSDRVH